MMHSGFRVGLPGFQSKVDVCPEEDYLTPLFLSVLICKTGETVVSTFPTVVRIKALLSVSDNH